MVYFSRESGMTSGILQNVPTVEHETMINAKKQEMQHV